MPCDTALKKGQSIQQRAEEIRRVTENVSAGLTSGRIKVRLGPQGAIAFEGLSETERAVITGGCIYVYRLLLNEKGRI